MPRICRAKGCTAFTPNESGRCDRHQQEKRRAYQQQTAYYHATEWRHLRRACLDRDHEQCVICAGSDRLTAHHIQSRTEGGADELGNLVTLCGRCHSGLEAGSETLRSRLAEHLAITPSTP
jgi:5-methylcytosine-specific restriction endonuclease McrA